MPAASINHSGENGWNGPLSRCRIRAPRASYPAGCTHGYLLNAKLVEAVQAGGIPDVTGTRWRGCIAIRAAFDNWAVTTENVVALQQAVAGAVAGLLAGDGPVPRQ